MRIWIVNHYALPPGSKGGPSRHLGISRALRDRGHEVTIIASAFDHYTRTTHRDLGGAARAIEDIDGVRYVWLATPAYGGIAGRIRNMVSFAGAARRHTRSLPGGAPEVVIGSSPHLLAAWAARAIAGRAGVPFVMEVRDLWPQSLVDLGDLRASNPAVIALRRLERSLYADADHVVVVPPDAGDYVSTHGGRSDRTTHLPNGVDLSTWPPPSPPRAPEPPFTVVYAGTLGHANGLEVVVEAARLLEAGGETGIAIRLIGAGPERERLRDQLASGGGTVLAIEEPVPSSAVPGVLADADACLMVLRDSPVFRWGISPTKLFEYFAAARPVVFAVRTPTDLVARAGGGVSATPGDARSLADAIVELRDVPADERAAMGARLRAYVEANHDFGALAAAYEGVLRDLTERAGGTVSR